MQNPCGPKLVNAIGSLLIVIFGVTTLSLWFWPKYVAYRAAAEAAVELHAAETRQAIIISDAETQKAAAVFTAEANQILSASLKDNEMYLRYLWVKGLQSGNSVIYVPTESNWPLMRPSSVTPSPVAPVTPRPLVYPPDRPGTPIGEIGSER